ncbi:galactoside alpha-(1,2)-fucosyltransferase 2-like [Anthonomus grandis grandis]|uniref:galactoside alpha-(1,2)-fucosyltransferase 2-like n=1 Tax=Anthonomus grandis grandis TaxID=2921223 RepID=UPI002165A3F4|nr:galactoside alpha-(1,2)-fucosyltransferase 2-like [Anthonomus grandis grandis]
MVLNKSPLIKFSVIITVFLIILYVYYLRITKQQTSPTIRRLETVIINYSTTKEVEERQPEGPTRIVYSYADLGVDLCDRGATRLDWPKKAIFNPETFQECPEAGIVTAVVGGRTGNYMWEYASTLALSKVTGLPPFMPKCLKDELSVIFQNLTVPTFAEISNCPIKADKYVEALDDWDNHTQSIILPRYHFQKAPVSMYLDTIRQEFTFRPIIKGKAEQILRAIVDQLPPSKYTFVAVHVRRTDYIKYLKRKYGYTPVDPSFFVRAMNYFKKKYPNCVFIFVSDEPKWCYETYGSLKNVFVPSLNVKYTPAVDLALMAACNHTIYDYGTFGDWGAFLAGGEVVMYNMTDNEWKPNYLENWSLMD